MSNWLKISFNILIVLIMLVGLLGMVIPIYPGVAIIWAAALVHGAVTGFANLEIWLLIVLTLLMVAGSLVDNFFIGGKARQAGASWWSIAGALIAGLIASFVFPPVGGLIAAPAILFLLEFLRLHHSVRAWQVTKGMLAGWGLAFLARFTIGAIMIALWGIWGWR